jgi:hypothetical protein
MLLRNFSSRGAMLVRNLGARGVMLVRIYTLGPAAPNNADPTLHIFMRHVYM